MEEGREKFAAEGDVTRMQEADLTQTSEIEAGPLSVHVKDRREEMGFLEARK